MNQNVLALEELKAKSALAWVIHNNFVNENDRPIEFHKHRFLAEPYNDDSPDLTVMKSAQVGWSTLAILKSFHALKYRDKNIIYVLPTQNVVKDFVTPKVDRLIEVNPELKKLVTKDNLNLKRVGDRFIYFKGAFTEREAIMVSAEMLVADEYDRADQGILTIYQSRLQAAVDPVHWRFSNPSVPAFGVHELYQNSDQMQWLVICRACRHEAILEFERDDFEKPHYVDQQAIRFACGKCHKEITTDDRQSGRWQARFPEVSRRGYHISQLMAPWVSAAKIIEQSREGIDFFYNFVLGKPYQASELLVNRSTISRCVDLDTVVQKSDIYMGVDSGKEKHWVLGNYDGIFAYGKAREWEEIENIFNAYNATTVIDALPDFTIPERLAREYAGRVFVHYYTHDQKTLEISLRDEVKIGVVKSDRTKLLDKAAGMVAAHTLKFFLTMDELEELIYHCENSYRIVEEDTRGIVKAKWMHKENKPDHFFHALCYYLVAREMSPRSGETGSTTPRRKSKLGGIHVEDGKVPVSQIVDIEESKRRATKRRRVRW